MPSQIIAFQYEQDGKFYADWIYEHNHPWLIVIIIIVDLEKT